MTRSADDLEALVTSFRERRVPGRADYEELFRYFLAGFERHRTPSGARAHYPGLPSGHGTAIDGLEGFARSAPLWGAWVRSGRPGALRLGSGRTVDLAEAFRSGLIAGTDPASGECWGEIRDRDQRIVEAADVALALWLFRGTVWDGLRAEERERVVSWLRQVEGKEVWDNNWHLFPILVDAVLRSLGKSGDPAGAERHWGRLKEFHRGDGWFSDGPSDVFDYYNAWGFHYGFAWLRRIDPSRDPAFFAEVSAKFLAGYRHLIGPEGFPVLGRSVCYRMAVAAPLVFGQATDPDVVSPAEARRALDATWGYFASRGALRGGNVTQGYFGSDPRVLDNYSGPASGLWSTRSLVAAFSFPEESPFWRAEPGLLPVEASSYDIELPAPGWRVTGDRESRAIVVERLRGPRAADAPLEKYGPKKRLAALLLGKANRPENRAAKDARRFYRSDRPFCA